MVRITIPFDDETHRRVKELAKKERRSFTKQVNHILDWHTERSDGLTDRRYLELVNSVRDRKEE
jgi:predicted transcriptional regulator